MSRGDKTSSLISIVKANEKTFKQIQETEKILIESERRKSENDELLKRQRVVDIKDKYAEAKSSILDSKLGQTTIGLVSAQEFREKRKLASKILEEEGNIKLEIAPVLKETSGKLNKSILSFNIGESDDDDIDEEIPIVEKKSKKDPNAETFFLIDLEREKKIDEERKKIIDEYKQKEEEDKKQKINVVYSYWDGVGHRKSIEVNMGDTIGDFLEEVRRKLSREFPELKSLNSNQLMFVKEDIILPNTLSFYEIIRDKLRGKSGNIFTFEVIDDIRMSNDIRIERKDSHAGKVIERKWYEKNKHTYPACLWEMLNLKK